MMKRQETFEIDPRRNLFVLNVTSILITTFFLVLNNEMSKLFQTMTIDQNNYQWLNLSANDKPFGIITSK